MDVNQQKGLMNRDSLNMVRPPEVVTAAYSLINTIQNIPKHDAVHALSLLMREVSSMLGVPVGELLNRADRIVGDLNTHYHSEIRALREYIKNEMR
ncbi:hypothetical protein NB640_12275 [Oxalobacter vibrioformis]|uniref:Uncharacterized protein n=1 Tax=Oxalobacter vibrioformis TaxID=933080 RepID=A0A9E9LWI3_9BURK|nr:hypothetical protein [Oxalobacter vibrioformis]WAW09977.1 hypothetical protein NB640_12275 [Oxalobacter vibrioformis]